MLIDISDYTARKKALIFTIFIAVYQIITIIGFLLIYKGIHLSPVWFPAGYAFAAILIFGMPVIPYIFIGSFLSTLIAASNIPVTIEILGLVSLISAIATVVSVYSGYKLFGYLKCDINFLANVRSTFIFTIIAVIISAIDATIGVSVRWGAHVAVLGDFLSSWFKWLMSDLVGILFLTPFIISTHKNIKPDISIIRIIEIISLFTVTFVFTQVIFGDLIQTELIKSLPFLVIPVLLWIAFRFTPRETTLASITVAIIAIYGTINDMGPFAREEPDISQMILQLYLGVTAVMAIVLSVSVQEKIQAIAGFKDISDSLERRVTKRTDELANLNKELLVEVNQRKKTQAELKESQARNQALLSSLPDIIFLFDRNGLFLDYQSPDGQKSALKLQDYIGKKIEDVFPHEISQSMKGAIKNALKSGKTQTLEYSDHSENKQNYYEARLSICGDDRVMSVVRDITDQKNAELQRVNLENQVRHAQKLESLGVLAGGIAHDFNNLLTAIMGNTGLALMQVPAKENVKHNLQNIEKASLRAADLCRQLLAYSGKGKFVVEAINMNDLIREMSKLLDVSKSKKVELVYDFKKDLPYFEADATQIRQVVMNLITNASEAIGVNNGQIIIKTGVMQCSAEYLQDSYFDDKLEEGHYIFLDVADTGSGMDEATRSKIFDPFFTTKFTGRGLGLAAVVGIVRGHKGAIKISSKPNEGTTFKILFPIKKSKLIPELQKEENFISWKGKGTILVVDDDESIRSFGKTTLEQAGLKVFTACDGRDAVKIYQENANDINLVLMDMTMPHLNGDEASQEIRKIKPDIKIIFSSGYSEQETSSKLSDDSINSFLQKPYKPTDLLQKVKDSLL
ncbi:MAG: MASE1 domain-containing protein [Calditrichae bacterium]|nr:MASE1 domain-containing protein [Calditrichia bacterium]